jgi:hypothetical protein
MRSPGHGMVTINKAIAIRGIGPPGSAPAP